MRFPLYVLTVMLSVNYILADDDGDVDYNVLCVALKNDKVSTIIMVPL